MEWYVVLIAGKYIAKSRTYNWDTTNLDDAERCRTALDALKLSGTIISLSHFPADVLIPLVTVKKVKVSLEDVPVGDISSDDSPKVGEADKTALPSDMGQQGKEHNGGTNDIPPGKGPVDSQVRDTVQRKDDSSKNSL